MNTRHTVQTLLLHLSLFALALVGGAGCSSTSGGGSGGAGSSSGTQVINDTGWPRVFAVNGVTNTLYQPQVQAWSGNQLTARAAVAVQAPGDKLATFGVINLIATTQVDKTQRTVLLENLQVTDAKFPSAPDQAVNYQLVFQNLLTAKATAISLDRLEASLAVTQARQQAIATGFNNTPPQILVSTSPALLVRVVGAPSWNPVAGTGLQRLVNTRALVLQDVSGTCYLHLYDGWVQAPSLSGPWTVSANPPAALQTALDQAIKDKSADLMAGQEDPKTKKKPSLATTTPPKIYLETQTAALLVFAGQPVWTAIPGTQLLYATNTAANVFQSTTTQQYYVLTSGRWFVGPSLQGPWAWTPANSLPADFASIPDDSPKENVKASVAGTVQASQAATANRIPQTAKVPLDTPITPPVIHGPIELAPINGTTLSYVRNSTTPIIQVNVTTWYALDKAVWFTGPSANGPWSVASSVPAVIYTIPPSSPLYYVTGVQVYSATAGMAYTGYTPAYYGSYINSDGVVVYGTGYEYAPWVSGPYFVSYPLTYGYGATLAWTPWFGWGYGFASAWDWDADWAYWACVPPAPFWGPYWGYCYGAAYSAWGGVAAWGPYGWAATSGNIYSHWGSWYGVSRVTGGYNAVTGNEWAGRYGHAYNSMTGTMAAGYRGTVHNVYTGNTITGGRGVAYNPSTGRSAYVAGAHGDNGGVYRVNNNVYATHDGNIYRATGDGWEQHNSSGGWDAARSGLNDDATARSWGENRSSAWGEHAGSWGGFGGGGFRGGFGGGGFGGFRR